MDALLFMACMASGICIPLLLIAIIIRTGTRPLSAAEAYKEVARQLTLTEDTRGIGVGGFYKQRILWIGQVLVGHGADHKIEYHGVLSFTRPLACGLRIHPKRWRKSNTDWQSGDETFDKTFQVLSYSPSSVCTQLLNSEARNSLLQLSAIQPAIEINDEVIRVRMKAPERNADRVMELLKGLECCVEILETNRASISVEGELQQIAEDWVRVSTELNMNFVETLPLLKKEAAWGFIEVSPRWNRGGFDAWIRVVFHEPSDTGFRITPQKGPSLPWLTGQDIQVQDPAFDSAFIIKGYHPGKIRSRLHPHLRTLLLDLHQSCFFDLNDQWMKVYRAPTHPEELIAILTKVTGIAEELAQ